MINIKLTYFAATKRYPRRLYIEKRSKKRPSGQILRSGL